MFSRKLVVALIATVVSFGTLYIPQPMLPLLAAEFGVSASDAGLLMTLAMLPLAVAPIVYGYFLQAIPARLMLLVALALLGIDLVCFRLATEFWHLLTLRLLQGLLLPAIFTALMTYCASTVAAAQVRRAMGFYIGATILGGFGGRLVGGIFASAFDWRSAFVVMGLLQLVPLLLLLRVEADSDVNFARLDHHGIARVLRDRDYRLMFVVLASVFFVFSGILNLAPFHLQDIDPGATPLLVSLLYLGYLTGVPISFYSDAIGRRAGSDRNGLLLAIAVHGVGLALLWFVAYEGLILTMFLLAGGFFLLHALLSGLANQLAQEHKGVVNGLYVSIYYFSGALGSWLPGYLYDGIGWHAMIGAFFGLLALGALATLRFGGAPR